MPLSYRQVSDLYDAAPRQQSFPDWAANMDQLVGDGSTQYSDAAHDPFKIKAASVGIDKLLEATGIPSVTERLGGAIGSLVGNEEAGASIGKSLPRATVNFAPLLALEVATAGASTPLTIGATAGALGATGALSGAETYTSTGSPVAGLVSGATNVLMPGAASAAEKFAGQAALKAMGGRLVAGDIATKGGIEAVSKYFPTTVAQDVASKAAAFGAGQVAAAGVGQAGTTVQQLESGEPVTSPFTTENLLGLTLGQLPFAAIHGTRAVLGGHGGPSAIQQADLLQHSIDVSEPAIAAYKAKVEQDKQPDVSKIAPLEGRTEATAAIAAETEAELAKVRAGQMAIKTSDNLTDAEKLRQTNLLLQQEADAFRQRQDIVLPQTVFGNKPSTDPTQRQELIGRQVWINATGSHRRILVTDDPSNPPELHNKVIGYVTYGEPAPVFGLQTQETQVGGGPNTGIGRFSLPTPDLQTTPKPAYEYFASNRAPAKRATAEQVKMEGSTIAPEALPLVNALNGKNVFTTGSTDRSVTVQNAFVDESKLPPQWSYDPDTGTITKAATVTDQGPMRPDEFQSVVNAVTPYPRQRITVGQAEGQPDLPVNEVPMSNEELQATLHEIRKVAVSAEAAQTPLDGQQAVVALNDVESGANLPLTDDSTLRPIMNDIAAQDVVPQNKVAQAAVTVASKLAARKLKAKQQALRELEAAQARGEEAPETFEALPTKAEQAEMADVAARFGAQEGQAGFSVRDLGHLSHGDDKQIHDMIAEEAYVAVSKGTDAVKAFNKWAGREDTTLVKDAKDFYDITGNFDVTRLPYQDVADFLNQRSGTSSWDEYEVRGFMIRPHVQLWLKAMNDGMGKRTELNAQRIASHTPTYDFSKESEADAFRRIDSESKLGELRGSAERPLRGLDEALNYEDDTTQGFGQRLVAERLETANEWLQKQGQASATDLNEAKNRIQGLIGSAETAFDQKYPGYRESRKQVSPAQGIPAGGGFIFGLKPTEQIQGLPKTGVLPETKFTNVGSQAGAFSKSEMDLMRNLVPEAFQGGQVDVNKLQEGLKTKGPVVEIHKRGEGRSEAAVADRERQQVIHELDTQLGPDWSTFQRSDVRRMGLTNDQRTLLDRYYELEDRVGAGVHDTGTYQFIAPKTEAQMPGYVEGLVRLGQSPELKEQKAWAKSQGLEDEPFSDISNEDIARHDKATKVLYRGPHFGGEDENVLSFYRGYEETLPDGQKAFHVIEVQSDWGQQRQKTVEALKKGKASLEHITPDQKADFTISHGRDLVSVKETTLEKLGFDSGGLTGADLIKAANKFINEHAEEIASTSKKAPPHPLLEAYNGLALKAAIQHAKEIGATKLIVSDGPTAMMTEGHDQYPVTALPAHEIVDRLNKVDPNHDKVEAQIKEVDGRQVLSLKTERGETEERIDPNGHLSIHQLQGLFNPDEFRKLFPDIRPEQEKGMTLHYDKTIPSTMEKLTGDKGQMVDLGQHKNAGYGERILNDRGEFARGPLEGSPVFKNPDGTPKTNITGRMYDLAQVPNEFTLMGKSREQVTTPRWEAEKPYVPQTSGEHYAAAQLGLDANGIGNGHGLLNYLKDHDDPFYRALGIDLGKLSPEALSRVVVRLREANGAYARGLPGGRAEITLPGNILNGSMTGPGTAFTVAHELIHGLTINEIDNPLKKGIVTQLDALRDRLINSLDPRLQKAFDSLQKVDWYAQYGNGLVDGDMNKALGLTGKSALTEKEQGILYGLMTTKEMAAQAFTQEDFRQFMQNVKGTPQKTGFKWFVNTVKSLLGIGEKVSDNAFGEFLGHTQQLLEQGDYVSSFNNYANRYFERLGQSESQVIANTGRAFGLVNDSIFGTDPAALLAQIRFTGIGRSPELAGTSRDLVRMIQERGDDFASMLGITAETGFTPNQPGLENMVNGMILGEIPNHGDVLDTLPPAAANHMFAVARDAKQILGMLQEATRDANKGVLNIADPKVISGPVAETLKGIDNVLKYEQKQQESQAIVDAWEGVPPSGFITNVVQNPEILPAWSMGVDKTKAKESHLYDLEPIAQWSRRVPEVAETVSKGWELGANQRKMATESLKVFATDLETMSLTKASVKLLANILKIPKLTRAADQWIYTNQKVGQEANAVKMLDADHPEIQKILAPLNDTERGQVEELVQKHQISQQQHQAQILEKMLQIAATRGAELTGMPAKEGSKLSSTLIDALRADRNNPVEARAADAQIQMVQQGMQPKEFLDLLKYSQAAVGEWNKMKEFYQENPAWSSGQRYGQYLVTYKRGNKTLVAGVDSKKEANVLTKGATVVEFKKNQKGDPDNPPNLGPDSIGMVQELRQFQQNQFDALLNSGRFTQEDIAALKQTSPVEAFITREAYKGGVPGLTPQPRGLTRGAEELPWLRNHFSWVKKSSTYWSRQLLRAQVHLQLLDPEIAANPELQAKLQQHFQNMLTPDSQVGHFFQRIAMQWFMGFNPASAFINATQPFLTHTAEFTSMTGKPVDSYRRTISALKDVAQYYATGKKSWGDPELDRLMHESAQDGEVDQAMFDDDAATQEAVHTNYKRIMDGQRPQTLGQKLGSISGSWSTVGMWMFRGVERINTMAAILSSFKYYKEQGFSYEVAKEKAYEFNHAVNYGGGPAQRPVAVFSGGAGVPRTAAMLATAMQSYNLGTIYQLGRYIQKGFFRPEGLAPGEVYAARKAAVQMLSVQLASAGVLGLPFVSGAIAVLNQLFPGLEVRRHLQEWMNDILGGDKEGGNVLADAAMMGVPSMFGWDLQSRLSMNNTIPGVSDVNGFDPQVLLGPPANMITQFVKGGVQLTTGDVSGIDKFVPPALKKIEQYARQGGIATDYRDRPVFTPTKGEVAGMALGFQPKRMTDFNNASRIAKQAQDNITRRASQFHQQMGEQILKGNFGNVRSELQKQMREDKKFDAASEIRSIAQAAEDLTFPRDLRREGSIDASDVRAKLLRTFNIPPTQPDESTRLQFRQGVEQRLGLRVSTGNDQLLAQVMDQLRRQSPGAARSDLRRQAELLLRGRRPQNVSLSQE